MTAFAVDANLAFQTRDELINAINDWMDRADLTGSAPAMIALCEARLRRELRPLSIETITGIAVADGAAALPADFDYMRTVIYDGNPVDEVSPEIGRQYGTGSIPRGYSLEAGALKTWPAITGTVTIIYQTRLPALSDANQSNELLLEHPDVYFFGSMMFAEGYLENDSRAALFKALWDEAIEGVKQFYIRQRRDRPRLRNPIGVV